MSQPSQAAFVWHFWSWGKVFNILAFRDAFWGYMGENGAKWENGRTLKQDRNSTYRCAIRGLRIYNLFNLFSLPIWVTFIFEWHSNLSENPICVTFPFERTKFEWHSNLSDIPFLATFKFERHSNLSYIPICVTFQFEGHFILSDIQF